MTQNGKITKISLGILMLISAVSVLLRSIAIIKYYNHANGYFSKNGLINTANVMIITAIFVFLISSFFGKKKENLRFEFSTPMASVTSGMLALAISFLGFMLILRAKFHRDTAASANASTDLISFLESFTAILAFLAVIYLILCSIKTQRHSTARGVLGLFTAVFFAAYATYLYFETSLPINAPNKMIDQMAYLFTALFFLFETRISLGRELWRPYVTTGLISATLCLYASIPSAIVYFSKDYLVSNSVFDFALTFFVAVYAIMRIVQYSLLKKDEESDFIFALRSNADEAEERISTIEEAQRLEYISLINKIGEENAILRAKEEARLAKEAKMAAALAQTTALDSESRNQDDENTSYVQESLFGDEVTDYTAPEEPESILDTTDSAITDTEESVESDEEFPAIEFQSNSIAEDYGETAVDADTQDEAPIENEEAQDEQPMTTESFEESVVEEAISEENSD